MNTDPIITTLHEVLAERVGRNHRYSMRSLARQLGISHPYLSRIISRRRKMSPSLRRSLEGKLRAITGRTELRLEGKTRELSVDEAKKVLHWKYFAVMKLMQARGFVSCPAWIAEKLGLGEGEVRDAIETLRQMGLIVLGPKGKLMRTFDNSCFDPAAVGESDFQKYFLSHFDVATKFIRKDALSAEWAGKVQTILLSPGRMKDAQTIIDQCIRRLVDLGESCEDSDRVYVAVVGLTPCLT